MTDIAVVVQKAYDWNLWILPKVEKFPKAYRFSLGQNLITTSTDLLMNLVDATYQSRNSATLGTALRNINRVRYLIRMCNDPLRAGNGTVRCGHSRFNATPAKKPSPGNSTH